jgi:hypothetical protein
MAEKSPGSLHPDLLLTWYGAERYANQLQVVRDFWNGKGRYLVSVYASGENYRQNFNLDEALPKAARHLEAQAKLPGINLPTLFPDWGTISTAKYWGGRWQFDSTGGNIFIHPVANTLDAALNLLHLPVDHPEMDAAHALAFFEQLKAALNTQQLWLRSPDMQGPLNTAGLVMNQETMFVEMYEQPQKVQAYLEKITEFIIAYASYLQTASGNRLVGNIWPYTFLPPAMGLSFTEDLMPLMSARLYREFGIPRLQRLAEAFGGLHIHCCGDWGRHVPNLKAARLPLRAMEYHHPATRIEELALLAEQTVFIPYIILHKQSEFASPGAYYRHLLKNTPPDFRYWFVFADDSPDALEFAAEYGECG